MIRHNRFFSMFDRRARVTMYNACKVQRYQGKGAVMEEDTEECDYI